MILRYSIYSRDGSLPYVRNKGKDNDVCDQNTIFFITDFSLEVTSLGLPFLSFKAVPATWKVYGTIKKFRSKVFEANLGRNYNYSFTLKMGLCRT